MINTMCKIQSTRTPMTDFMITHGYIICIHRKIHCTAIYKSSGIQCMINKRHTRPIGTPMRETRIPAGRRQQRSFNDRPGRKETEKYPDYVLNDSDIVPVLRLSSTMRDFPG